ncbi:MAG: hypothetical protein ABIX01_22965 [Chitinophagaceae bacterium]
MLEQMILEEHSKAQKDKIVAWVGTDQKRFDELVALFLNSEYRVTQRSGWPLSYIAAGHPKMIKKHLKAIIQNMKKPGLHNAVKRNTVRMLQYIDIPKSLQGEVMNCCFEFIEAPKEAVAVKVFSLTVLYNLSKLYPEILPEIKLIIEARWAHETAAFRSRARRIMDNGLMDHR